MKVFSGLIKKNEWEKHAKTCAEGVQCLNWLAVKPAPRDFIESYIGGSDYWANNIRKEFRNVNADQIAFCDTFKKIITELMVYVKEYHTTGVSWNAKGVDVADYNPDQAASAVAGAKAAVAEVTKAVASATVTPAAASTSVTKAPVAAIGNVFAELSKSGSVTSG